MCFLINLINFEVVDLNKVNTMGIFTLRNIFHKTCKIFNQCSKDHSLVLFKLIMKDLPDLVKKYSFECTYTIYGLFRVPLPNRPKKTNLVKEKKKVLLGSSRLPKCYNQDLRDIIKISFLQTLFGQICVGHKK